MSGSNLEAEFPQQQDLCYLNHAAVGPWPKRTQLATAKFALENVETGAQHYSQWLKVESRLRQRLANLIQVTNTGDIALAKNTSEALSQIAYGVNWETGDNIVISNQEFPSNRIVWESLARYGVAVKVADITQADSPEQALIDTLDSNTRLLSISSVQYASGLKLNCEQLGAACKERDILFCIDAIQSIGARVFETERYQADFVVADGHKWMLGPEGLALFYSRRSAREQLSVKQYGWHMVKHRGDYDRLDWELAENATRFECGSPNMLGIHALEASLSLLEQLGMKAVSALLEEKVQYLIDGLEANPDTEILSATEPSRRAGIVTFSHSQYDSAELHRKLVNQGVICAHRGGGVRFSPHFYTPVEKLDRTLGLL